MKDKPLPSIDWDSVLLRSLGVAYNLFRKQGLLAGPDAVLKGVGKSPGDLVNDAVTTLYANLPKYDADTEDKCFALIIRIMKNDFLDIVTKNSAYTTSDDVEDEEFRDRSVDHNGSKAVTIADLAKKFYKYANDDDEAKEVIDAAAMIAVEQSTPVTREDIASLLRITPEEVTKRTARLRYRFHAETSMAESASNAR